MSITKKTGLIVGVVGAAAVLASTAEGGEGGRGHRVVVVPYAPVPTLSIGVNIPLAPAPVYTPRPVLVPAYPVYPAYPVLVAPYGRYGREGGEGD